MKRIIIAEDVQLDPVAEPAIAPMPAQAPVQTKPISQPPIIRQKPTKQEQYKQEQEPEYKAKMKEHYKNIDYLHAKFKEEMNKNIARIHKEDEDRALAMGADPKSQLTSVLTPVHDIPLPDSAHIFAEELLKTVDPNGNTFLQWAAKAYFNERSKYHKLTFEDAMDEVTTIILNGLRNPGKGNITDYVIQESKKEVNRYDTSKELGSSKKTDIRLRSMNDYLNWLAHPEIQDQPGVKGKVDDDIIDKIGTVDETGQKFTPAHAADAQRKRDLYLDVPIVGDKLGRRRIEFAIDKFIDFFSDIFANEKQQFESNLAPMSPDQRIAFSKKNFEFASRWDLISVEPISINPKIRNLSTLNERFKDLQDLFKEQIKAGVEPSGDMSFFKRLKPDKTPNEFWLSPEMLEQKSPEVLNELWSKVTGKSSDETINEEPLGQYEHTQNRTHPLRKSEEDNPSDVLENIFNSILDNDESKIQDPDTIRSRLGLILPYKQDQTGKVQKNPAFKKALEYVVDQLYGPNSKPLFKNRAIDDTTKHVLQLIGKDFAEKFSKADALEQRYRNTKLEEAIQNHLPDIGLRHMDKDLIQHLDPDETEQMQSVATGEMMTDILNFIRDDKNYQELLRLSGSHKAMAGLRKAIRTASFLALSKIILRG